MCCNPVRLVQQPGARFNGLRCYSTSWQLEQHGSRESWLAFSDWRIQFSRRRVDPDRSSVTSSGLQIDLTVWSITVRCTPRISSSTCPESAVSFPFPTGGTSMNHSAGVWSLSNGGRNTLGAIDEQVRAMGSLLFEIGLYKIDAAATESPMIPRTWDTKTMIASAGWLRHQNRSAGTSMFGPKASIT